jgi:hypothetical protein
VWYLGLTGAVLAFAYRDRGLWRVTGFLIIVAYLVFAGTILGLAYHGPQATRAAVVAGVAVAAVFAAQLAVGRRPPASCAEQGPSLKGEGRRNSGGQARGQPLETWANGSGPHSARSRMTSPSHPPLRQQSLLAGWPVSKLWALSLQISFIVAAVDVALGNRVILIGALIAGPCCVVLTGRWVPTALTGLWVTGLAVALGIPDGIWATANHFTWLGAVAAVALVTTLAAASIQTNAPPRNAQ